MPKRSLPSPQKSEQLDQAISALLAGKGEGVRAHITDPEIGPLLKIAADLLDLPREEFKARLKSDLQEGRSNMATMPKSPAPQPVEHETAAHPSAQTGRVVASPRVAYRDVAKAIEFYTKAFGAREMFRFEVGGNIPHAEIVIGKSVIALAGEWPEGGRFSAETVGQSPVQLSLQVENVDDFAARAVAAGLKPLGPIKDQFYGHREGSFVDPFGYTWNIFTVTEPMSVEEMHRRMERMEPPRPAAAAIPRGFSTLTSYLVAQDADALVEFLKKTFGAEETFRSGPGSEGGMHCEVRLEDSMLMVGGGGPGFKWRGTPKLGAFHVYVPNCDATYEKALQAGAESVEPPQDQFYGERSASVRDAAGDHWYIATRKGENYKWPGAPTLQPYLHPLRAEPVINFLKRAFGAEELERHATPDGVIHHTTVKIGNALMEMGEAHGKYQPTPAMFYLYVQDCDAIYRRALTAGATSLHEPVDQPYGDRSGAVTDPFGNQWYIATHIKDTAPGEHS